MLVENRLALTGGITAFLALILFVVGVREVTRQQFPERPRSDRTPGAVLPIAREHICGGVPAPEISKDTREWVFDHYGIDRPTPEDYELDFLIPPSLGGIADKKNLWPQPRRRLEWNSKIKNALEQRLAELVCNQQISIDEAQRALSRDWIASYQKYFHARLPLQVHQNP